MKINQPYMEVQPAYGRDYKSKKEVEQAFRGGKDFIGDQSVGFKFLSVNDFAPGTPVLLRYKQKTMVASIKV